MNAFAALNERMVCGMVRDFFGSRAAKQEFDRVDAPLLFQASVAQPRRVLYLTKDYALRSLDLNEIHRPRNASVFVRGGLATPAYGALVGCEAVRSNADVHFVGDLDPWDWTVFLTLLIELRKHGVDVHYAGVNDAWLNACRAVGHRKFRDLDLTAWTIGLGRLETDLFQRICRLRIPWERVVGPSAFRLLQEGHKLELEGATNPAIYKESHHAAIRKMLLGTTTRKAGRG